MHDILFMDHDVRGDPAVIAALEILAGTPVKLWEDYLERVIAKGDDDEIASARKLVDMIRKGNRRDSDGVRQANMG